MTEKKLTNRQWMDQVVKQDEISKYYNDGKNFIDSSNLESYLDEEYDTSKESIRAILKKSLAIETLSLKDLATLIQVKDPDMWDEMFEVARQIKVKVYNNRIVTFAPIYMSNLCVNNCEYCGFKTENNIMDRRILSMDEVKKETEVIAGHIGHKRVISVYGEHPRSDANYIIDSLKAMYSVKAPTKNGFGSIRRANVNAAPMSIYDLERLKVAGIGTFQVFQETYHRDTYEKVHPQNTIKGNYEWRLYCMHRSQEAGVDDVGMGALFGLYDWRYELLGLQAHSIDLEKKFGIGPHTLSCPRLQPASGSELSTHSKYLVNDEDYVKIAILIRLAVPYTGLIITVRESPEMMKKLYPIMTQRDASSNIKIGGYAESFNQIEDKQQFVLADTTSLDQAIRELSDMGYITSFCTAGYRCGRTGKIIMKLLRCGREGQFCKLNAILTFREWLDDFATPETKIAGEKIIRKEMEQVKNTFSAKEYEQLVEKYDLIKKGERDLYF